MGLVGANRKLFVPRFEWLRVKHVSAGKPDWIFLARFESINGRAKTFK